MEDNKDFGKDQQTQDTKIDYEQEFKKMQLENEKLKNAISKTNSENAEYKRKELEKLSVEEQTKLEIEEMRKQIANYTLEKSLQGQGYTVEEVAKLMADNCSPKAYAEIMNARLKSQETSMKADALAKSKADQSLGKETNGEEKSYAERLAEKRNSTNSQDIKNLYK